jgi:hypothetical protein
MSASPLVGENSNKKREIQRLEEYLAHQSQELAKQEDELRALLVVVEGLRASVSLHSQLLAELRESDSGASDRTIEATYRSPTEMLRPHYKGKKLADAIIEVLNQSQSPITTTELCRVLYNPKSEDEFDRARNSLSSELRSGAKAKDPKWRKIGRYAYAAL